MPYLVTNVNNYFQENNLPEKFKPRIRDYSFSDILKLSSSDILSKIVYHCCVRIKRHAFTITRYDFMNMTGYSLRSVSYALKELEELGIIQKIVTTISRGKKRIESTLDIILNVNKIKELWPSFGVQKLQPILTNKNTNNISGSPKEQVSIECTKNIETATPSKSYSPVINQNKVSVKETCFSLVHNYGNWVNTEKVLDKFLKYHSSRNNTATKKEWSYRWTYWLKLAYLNATRRFNMNYDRENKLAATPLTDRKEPLGYEEPICSAEKSGEGQQRECIIYASDDDEIDLLRKQVNNLTTQLMVLTNMVKSNSSSVRQKPPVQALSGNSDTHIAITKKILSTSDLEPIKQFRQKLLEKIGEKEYLSWFDGCGLLMKDKQLIINTHSAFKHDMIERRYWEKIAEVCRNTVGITSFLIE